MQRIEYHTADKSTWGEGPWQDEPDKVQWQDEETGYPCLIVRNPHMGFLCGYVGVPPGHPAHGLSYDGELSEEHKARMALVQEKMRKATRNPTGPKSILGALTGIPDRVPVPGIGEALQEVEAHGGLTFADGCSSHGPEEWEAHKKWLESPTVRDEARRFPKGDAGRSIAEWEPVIHDYALWVEKKEGRSICHRPDPGEPDDVWWFGFDCGHAFDASPGMKQFREEHGLEFDRGDTYRDLPYVASEVQSLAEQLKALETVERK